MRVLNRFVRGIFVCVSQIEETRASCHGFSQVNILYS